MDNLSRTPGLNSGMGCVHDCRSSSSRFPTDGIVQAKISWGGKIRVDGLAYSWMGQYDVQNSTANVTDIKITPTRSIFYMQAGPMNLTVTFLSPVEVSL